MELTTTIDLKTKAMQSEVVVPSLRTMNFIRSYARTFLLISPETKKENTNTENEFIKELD